MRKHIIKIKWHLSILALASFLFTLSACGEEKSEHQGSAEESSMDESDSMSTDTSDASISEDKEEKAPLLNEAPPIDSAAEENSPSVEEPQSNS